jgi:hypothetical protein
MLTVVLLLLLGLAALVAYWALRPNRSQVDPRLDLATWVAVGDGLHNSNTDLIHWRDHFYLIHAASPYHMGSAQCRLVLRRSRDARNWETVREFSVPGQDIRDPKFAAIGERLILYAFPNEGFRALPYRTIYSVSSDGESWSPFENIEQPGWLFWRPKSRDGSTWYVPAYWHQHGKSALFSSTDGIRWSQVSTIYDGEANDETDFEFLPDGRMLCTARLEVVADSPFGHRDASTLLAVAVPPYAQWSYTKSRVTRLDGPALFSYEGRVYAVARYQPGARGPLTGLGSMLSRKRTSLFLVEPDRLLWLSDFPSAGDTSYAGVVLRDGALWASYYTSDINRDFPWALGMVRASDIRMARVDLASLARLAADAKP